MASVIFVQREFQLDLITLRHQPRSGLLVPDGQPLHVRRSRPLPGPLSESTGICGNALSALLLLLRIKRLLTQALFLIIASAHTVETVSIHPVAATSLPLRPIYTAPTIVLILNADWITDLEYRAAST